jgi:tetratricopeptide (TPR) repeat protein
MNYSRSLPGALVITAVIAMLAVQNALAADEPIQRTGSRIGSDTTSRTVIPISQESELARVRKLLEAGENEAAVTRAEDYLKSLDSANIVGVSPAQQRYDTLNLLCTALTKGGRLDEAIARCTEAIELLPSRWSAVNNRGTVLFVQRNFVAALEDYRRARDLVRERDDRMLVEHNIVLTQTRLEALRGDR